MRLLREFYTPSEVNTLIVEHASSGEKNVYINGVFAEAETKNKNGRIYPIAVMEREAYKLKKLIAEGKLTGELDHPEKPEILLQNAAIKITSLTQQGNQFIGEAKILKDTPKGAIAYALAKEGIKPAHYDMRFVKPLDTAILHDVFTRFSKVITVEDGTIMGGFGSAVAEFMVRHRYGASLRLLGIPDEFIEQGTQRQLYRECGFDSESIAGAVKELIQT
jgi:hypothetical protein